MCTATRSAQCLAYSRHFVNICWTKESAAWPAGQGSSRWSSKIKRDQPGQWFWALGWIGLTWRLAEAGCWALSRRLRFSGCAPGPGDWTSDQQSLVRLLLIQDHLAWAHGPCFPAETRGLETLGFASLTDESVAELTEIARPFLPLSDFQEREMGSDVSKLANCCGDCVPQLPSWERVPGN